MIPKRNEPFETQIRRLAAGFPYPKTPDLAARLTPGKVALQKPGRSGFGIAARYALVALLVLFGIAMLVPSVRAAVLEFLQIGGIRINLQTPAPAGASIPGALEQPADQSDTATPWPRLFSDLDLSGEISLEKAARAWGEPIMLPDPTGALGLPDRTYLQRRNGLILILLWFDPDEPGRLLASQILLQPGAFLTKSQPDSYQSLEVRGQQGIWLQGGHDLILERADRQGDMMVWVTGNVLIWEENGVTYRLESQLDLDQAQAIAESMQPYP